MSMSNEEGSYCLKHQFMLIIIFLCELWDVICGVTGVMVGTAHECYSNMQGIQLKLG